MKVMYKYQARRIPVEAIETMDAIYSKRKPEEPELRKADLWIEASNKLKGKKK